MFTYVFLLIIMVGIIDTFVSKFNKLVAKVTTMCGSWKSLTSCWIFFCWISLKQIPLLHQVKTRSTPREVIKLWQSSTFLLLTKSYLVFNTFMIQERFGLFCWIFMRSRPLHVGFSLKVNWLIRKWKRTLPWKKNLEFVTNIFNQPADFGEKIVDDVVVEMVLNALPKSYEYYV